MHSVITVGDKETAKAINDLARLKTKEMILKDLAVDLMICKIEGYDHRQYINELKTLIDDVYSSIIRPHNPHTHED